MAPAILDYAPRAEFDTGRFVARYLQVLAFISIAWMVAGPIFFHSLFIDLSPIFHFWAASALKRRSRTARKWVLAVGGLTVCLLVGLFLSAVITGTNGMTVSFGIGTIKNPALWQVALVMAGGATVVAIPVAVLMSGQARRQFRAAHTTVLAANTAEIAAHLSKVR